MEKSLVKRDQEVIWHPYTQQKYAPESIPIVKGDGVYLVDENGKTYIDAISSWWVNLHGHGHPYIAEKIYQQAKTLEHVIFAGFTHEPAVHLAERLLAILPGNFSKIFYSDNGSTAVEVAIKMSIQYWWNMEKGVRSQKSEGKEAFGVNNKSRNSSRNKIVALSNSYHGDTFGAMSVSDRGIFTLAFDDKLFDVIFIDPGDPDVIQHLSEGILYYQAHHNGSRVRVRTDEIACFIYEPLLQGAGGMKIYDAASFDRILKEFKGSGIICIADEVMTGFGRTGKFFSSEYMSTLPDIICLSKGITGGTMALGATACSKKIHDAFVSNDRLKTFFHGHSYTANPLACTAALASLELLQQNESMKSIERIGEQHRGFVGQLRDACGDYSESYEHRSNTARTTGIQTSAETFHRVRIKNPRCLGTILAFEIESGKDEYLNTISTSITKKALSKGVLLRPLGNTVYIMPPYCITPAELQKVYDVILEIINEG